MTATPSPLDGLLGEQERRRLQALPRRTPGSTRVHGRPIHFVDAASLLSTLHSLFVEELYFFRTDAAAPFIIDGGANIGLSMLYFKTLFPSCRIVAFEADPVVFSVLQANLEAWRFSDVELHAGALWKERTDLRFWREGADGGRLVTDAGTHEWVTVPAFPLSPFLAGRVDMLKLDIEGAEAAVIEECDGKLNRVERLYIEYHSLLGRRQSLDRILAILTAAGLRYHIRGIGFGPRRPLVERKAYLGMDLQLHIFAVRDPAPDQPAREGGVPA